MDITTKFEINHLSLCSGYDGIGKGLRTIYPNLREIAHVEIEAFAVANLVAKMETGKLASAPIYTNLKTFPYRKFRGLVDILSGGFPCQPFSTAGNRKGTEDPRHLFPYILRGIKECRPSIVFLENVEGIFTCKTREGYPVLQYVLRSLEELGYKATAGIFSASEIGSPHQRKRVFILGVENPQELGDSEYFRLPASEKSGSLRKTVYNFSEGKDCSCQSSGTNISRKLAEFKRWPSHPGESQYFWEEPRSVEQDNQSEREIQKRKSQSQLGGTTNGSSFRVDRLRLLGNGVVPQTANLAFQTLLKRLI